MNGMTFCQGCFATMGEDIPAAIRHFGKMGKIYFVHFRDVQGDRTNFHETFHDDGKTDMYEAMRCYYEVGFDGIARPDHVPTMVGEDDAMPSYGLQGNRGIGSPPVPFFTPAACKERGSATLAPPLTRRRAGITAGWKPPAGRWS